MTNPGLFDLGDASITLSSPYVGAWVTDLEGMTGLSVQFLFLSGGGGTSLVAYLQTSLDQGNTAIDLAAAAFATTSGAAIFNLAGASILTPYTPTDGALTPGTAIDGPLGDMLRLKVISLGTYLSPTVVSARAAVR